MKLSIYADKKIAVEPSFDVKAEKGSAKFAVKACGICGSDISRVFGGTSYYYPIVLGHEFAGVVEDSENPELIGKRAAVFRYCPAANANFVNERNGLIAALTATTALVVTAVCRAIF